MQKCLANGTKAIEVAAGSHTVAPLNISGIDGIRLSLSAGAQLTAARFSPSLYPLMRMWPSWGPHSGKTAHADFRFSPLLRFSDCQNLSLHFAAGAALSGRLDPGFPLPYDPPLLLELDGVSGAALDGVVLHLSPFWAAHVYRSHDVRLTRVTIDSEQLALAVDSSKDVVVSGATLRSGDDNLSFKSGIGWFGAHWGGATENVLVETTRFEGGFGVVFGSEMGGGVRNVTVRDCHFEALGAPLYLKTKMGGGGALSDIQYLRNTVELVAEAIRVTMVEESHVTPNATNVGKFERVLVRDMKGTAGKAGIFDCFPEMPCTDFVLENVELMAAEGFSCSHVVNSSSHHVNPRCCF